MIKSCAMRNAARTMACRGTSYHDNGSIDSRVMICYADNVVIDNDIISIYIARMAGEPDAKVRHKHRSAYPAPYTKGMGEKLHFC